MALFSKKTPVDDAWGSKDLPYRTNSRTLDDYGIYPVRGRTRRAISIQKFIVLFIVASFIIFMTVVFFNSLKANSGVSQTRAEIMNSASPAFKVRYASLGEEVIRAYYGGEKPVCNLLPSAPWPGIADAGSAPKTSVDVTGLQLIRGESSTGAIPKSVLEKDKTKTFRDPRNELLTYTGVIDGRQYTFTVNLLIPDDKDAMKLPYLAAPPTLQPMETLIASDMEASRPDDSGKDTKFGAVELNDASISRISEWASAYAQDNRETLKMITGDGNINATYRGVGGYALQGTPTVMWAYERKEDPKKEDSTGTIYARIKFNMQTSVSNTRSNAAQQVQGSTSSNEFSVEQVFDVLLANYSEGTPNLVAWTPGGSWYNLQPKMNALILEEGIDGPKPAQDAINPDSTEVPTATTTEDAPSAPGAPKIDTPRKSKTGTPSSTAKSTKTGEKKSSSQNKTSTPSPSKKGE